MEDADANNAERDERWSQCGPKCGKWWYSTEYTGPATPDPNQEAICSETFNSTAHSLDVPVPFARKLIEWPGRSMYSTKNRVNGTETRSVTVSHLILGMHGGRSARSSDLHDSQVGGDAGAMSSPRQRKLIFELVFLVHRVWCFLGYGEDVATYSDMSLLC